MLHDPDLMRALEPGQLLSARRQKLPRRQLSRVTVALLWAMRIYVTLSIPLVAYAFIRALQHG